MSFFGISIIASVLWCFIRNCFMSRVFIMFSAFWIFFRFLPVILVPSGNLVARHDSSGLFHVERFCFFERVLMSFFVSFASFRGHEMFCSFIACMPGRPVCLSL